MPVHNHDFFALGDVETIDNATGDDKNPRIQACVSTEAKNRHDHCVLHSAFDLNAFKKYAPFCIDHGTENIENVIGRWVKLEIEERRGLIAQAEYFLDNPKAEWPYRLATEHKLAAFSISFVPNEGYVGSKAINDAKDVPKRIKNQEPFIVFTKVDLIEISQVVVPANKDAYLHSLGTHKHPDNLRYLMDQAGERKLYEQLSGGDEDMELPPELKETMTLVLDRKENLSEDNYIDRHVWSK